MDFGIWSLSPLLVALGFAFTTRSAALSLLSGVVVGAFMLDGNPAVELSAVFQESLATQEFIWVCEIVIFIGIITELLNQSGSMAAFSSRLAVFGESPKKVKVTAWGMGLFIIDDYFSPLLSGPILRPLFDKARIPREKLAFILDSTTASVCVLVPFLSWSAYIVSLIIVMGGPVTSPAEGMGVFISSIPYNFYSILLVGFTLGIAMQWIPDYGPMRKAERRAKNTGLLLRKGASPLMTESNLNSRVAEKPYFIANLFMPIVIVVTVAVGSYVLYDSVMIAEAFMLALAYLSIMMLVTRQVKGLKELGDIAMRGIQSVIPALLIVALAYALNSVTQSLGAADWIIGATEGWLSARSMVVVVFLMTALISFSTGTSWGAFALMIPLALPLAYSFTGGLITPLVFKTVAAITGGGIFGDHASPLSDTSVLASAGAGSDHMDHVITQLPYALTVATMAALLYFFV